MRVYTHPSCLLHDNGEGHPESISRLQAVLQALRSEPQIDWRMAPMASRAALARAHDEALIEQVLQPVDGPLQLDPDTLLGPHSADAALHASGAAIAAVDAALSGDAPRSFCAVRPPGHHATRNRVMGFCLFNHIAVAALHALEAHGLQRVGIVDFDVHHGNGTASILGSDPRICFLNSHQQWLYPYDPTDPVFLKDFREEPRSLSLPPGSHGDAFRALWRERLLPQLDAFQPQLLLISAGFDAHRLDPLAALQLEAADFAWITQELVAVAQRHAQGRMVSLLEGGYSLPALRESVLAHVRALGESPA